MIVSTVGSPETFQKEAHVCLDDCLVRNIDRFLKRTIVINNFLKVSTQRQTRGALFITRRCLVYGGWMLDVPDSCPHLISEMFPLPQ